MSEEQNEKPQIQETPINETGFLKWISDFFKRIPLSRPEKVVIFKAYESVLNSDDSIYPRKPLQRCEASVRTFKHYYIKNWVSFSSNADVKNYKAAQKEEKKYSVQTDFMEFERQCRMFGINNDVSRENLYFDMKLNDFKQGVMRVYSDKEIYDFICKYFEMYLKYEPKKEFKKSKRNIPINERDRQYLIEDLF